MSYTPSSPFNLSATWNASSPHGASAWPMNWAVVGTVTDPSYPGIKYYTATPPAGVDVMAQMTVIGDGGGVRTSFYASDGGFTDDEVTGQKFDAAQQIYNSGVDEAISATSTGMAFRALPRRAQNLGFICSTHSRLMLFACEV